MTSVLSRDYCLHHPLEIGRCFGAGVLVGALLDRKRPVLERVARSVEARRAAMPGALGDAYRLSALFELRAARIYRGLAERFAGVEPACQLFRELQEEEEDHARLMRVCLRTVHVAPQVDYAPSVRDPEIRALLREVRAVQRRVPTMTLQEALQASEDLERSEVNAIFGRLLKQVEAPGVDLLRRMLDKVEDHAESVPRRIAGLRRQLGVAALHA